jgi:hypothetical protein
LFTFAANIQASDLAFDAASDWKNTYANTAAVVASTTPTWGNVNGPAAWSAGNLSYNFTNFQVLGQADGTPANGNYFLNYYQPTTGHETSGGSTVTATYTYTVPFQANPFTPGTTMHQQVGATLANQITFGHGSEASSTSLILAPNTTVGTGAFATTSTFGSLTEVGAAKAVPSSTNTAGFTTTSYNPTGGKYSDGGGSIQAAATGVFYNYGASTSSTSLAALNFPSSSTYDVLQMTAGFSGPTYIAWTAPTGGFVTIGVTATTELAEKASCGFGLDGDPGFYIVDPSKGNFQDPTSLATPGLFVSAPNLNNPGNGGQASPGDFQNYGETSSIGGSFAFSNPNQGTGSSGTTGFTDSMTWTSNTNAVYVTSGETLYFVTDPATGQYLSHSNHAFGYGKDPIALSAQVTLVTPEPSSIVLLGTAAVGLALAAWRRRRVVA